MDSGESPVDMSRVNLCADRGRHPALWMESLMSAGPCTGCPAAICPLQRWRFAGYPPFAHPYVLRLF